MGKILLFVSFAVTLLAAGLGFINKGKYSEAVAAAESDKAALASKNSELAAKEKALTDAKTALEAANTEKAGAASQITAAQNEASAAKAQVADLTTRATAAEAKVTSAEADVASLQAQIKDLQANSTPQTAASSPEDKARIEELTTVNSKLQGDLDNIKQQLEAAQKATTDRQALQMRDRVEGRVLAVNPSWNFVVLNLGDKQGVVNNAELLVKRGRQLVGKVRITSVEPSTSIADIVANSVPSGTVITPGDNVIFQSVEE